MTHSHSVIYRERQRIGKRAVVIHLATNRYLSQHIETFRYYSKQVDFTFSCYQYGSLRRGCNQGEDANENDINWVFFLQLHLQLLWIPATSAKHITYSPYSHPTHCHFISKDTLLAKRTNRYSYVFFFGMLTKWMRAIWTTACYWLKVDLLKLILPEVKLNFHFSQTADTWHIRALLWKKEKTTNWFSTDTNWISKVSKVSPLFSGNKQTQVD